MSLTVTSTEAVRPLEAASQPSPAAPPVRTGTTPLGLITDLVDGLTAYAIPACQWKGHWKPERWGTGVGDIDLLVGPDAAPDLAWLLRRLGFKEGVATEGVPGMASLFGLDRESGRLVHVHVHHRLLMGRMWATYYRVPIEQAVLASSRGSQYFRTPAPELELLLLVLDQSLRRSPLDILLRRGTDRVAAA